MALGAPARSHSAGTATSMTPMPMPSTPIVASRVRTPGEASAPASPRTRSGAGRHAREAGVSTNMTVPISANAPQATAAAGIEMRPPIPATISTGPAM